MNLRSSLRSNSTLRFSVLSFFRLSFMGLWVYVSDNIVLRQTITNIVNDYALFAFTYANDYSSFNLIHCLCYSMHEVNACGSSLRYVFFNLRRHADHVGNVGGAFNLHCFLEAPAAP